MLQVLFQNLTEFERKIGTRVGDDVDVTKTALAFVEGGVTMPKDIILNFRPYLLKVAEIIDILLEQKIRQIRTRVARMRGTLNHDHVWITFYFTNKSGLSVSLVLPTFMYCLTCPSNAGFL